MLTLFIKASDEEKFLLFQHIEINSNERWCLISMLDAGLIIKSIQIDQMRYVNEVLHITTSSISIHWEIKRIGICKKNQHKR